MTEWKKRSYSHDGSWKGNRSGSKNISYGCNGRIIGENSVRKILNRIRVTTGTRDVWNTDTGCCISNGRCPCNSLLNNINSKNKQYTRAMNTKNDVVNSAHKKSQAKIVYTSGIYINLRPGLRQAGGSHHCTSSTLSDASLNIRTNPRKYNK